MPNRIAALLVRPGRAPVCLAMGAVLLMLGGFNVSSDAASAKPLVRHDVARRAIDDLDALRQLTVRLGDPMTQGSWVALTQGLKQARTALGADMIALRELVRPGDEETTLRAALAAEASYQAAWIEARDQVREKGVPGAAPALARVGPLGRQAATALASLSHSVDEGNRTVMATQATAERADRFRNAGLALVIAALLLLALARLTGNAIGRESLPG